MKLRPLLCAVLFVSLPPSSAWAGLFDDEEARRQIAAQRAETQQTLDGLKEHLETLAKNQIDFANQVESLRAELARLTGQVEVLANTVESAHKRQQDFYVDLDARLRKLESAAMAATAPAPASPDPQAEMRDYETALSHFRESRFKEAQAAFEAFIAKYPQSAMLPNAHYWLGSSLYQQKLYESAAKTFGQVAATWPNDPKAPDALLAQANALVGAKNVGGAVKVLETVVEKYPSSPTATTARERIKTYAPKKKR